jgi:glutaredoxin 3
MQTVTLYSTEYCGYCRAAKSLLSELEIPFDEVDLSEDPEARMALIERTGERTVPQIYVGETHVGGFTELRALHLDGGLLPLVHSEG